MQSQIYNVHSKTQLPAGAPAGTLLRNAGCIPTFSTRGN